MVHSFTQCVTERQHWDILIINYKCYEETTSKKNVYEGNTFGKATRVNRKSRASRVVAATNTWSGVTGGKLASADHLHTFCGHQ